VRRTERATYERARIELTVTNSLRNIVRTVLCTFHAARFSRRTVLRARLLRGAFYAFGSNNDRRKLQKPSRDAEEISALAIRPGSLMQISLEMRIAALAA